MMTALQRELIGFIIKSANGLELSETAIGCALFRGQYAAALLTMTGRASRLPILFPLHSRRCLQVRGLHLIRKLESIHHRMASFSVQIYTRCSPNTFFP